MHVKLPDGITEFAWQIAGHRFLNNSAGKKEGISVLYDNKKKYLLKPIQDPHLEHSRGQRELEFYEKTWSDTCGEPLRSLQKYIPQFFGTRIINFEKFSCGGPSCPALHGNECPQIPAGSSEHKFIVLEDVAKGYLKPCIADIKIGARTWDPDAAKEKIEREKSKYPWAEQLGFRFLGMLVQNPDDSSCVTHGEHCHKDWGLALNPEAVQESFFRFFGPLRPPVSGAVVGEILNRLKEILVWFKGQKKFAFYSSSILLAYDSAQTAESFQKPICNAKMIDFTHVFATDENENDGNYIRGLENLIKFVEKVLESKIQ